MKKNLLQILTLLLCMILLAVTVCQAKRIEALEQQMENRIDNLQEFLNMEIQKLSANVQRELEDANSLVHTFTLEPCGLDADSGTLAAELSVELKQWSEDTQVMVLAQMDGSNTEVPLEATQNGIYTGRLQLPLENGSGLSAKYGAGLALEVHITSNGTTRSQQLGSWGDLSMLLPLRVSGSGWSGPNYVNGAMTTQFHIVLEGAEGKEVAAQEPEFAIYKNGVLADAVPAVIDPDTFASGGVCYTADTPGNFYALDCEPSDIIEIRFRCRDVHGLRYDFLLMIWSAEQKLAEPMTGDALILSWEN